MKTKIYGVPFGLDKRQRRRFIRRNDLKYCNCYSSYEYDGRVMHYAECSVVRWRMGW